jgi:hypothetical protein
LGRTILNVILFLIFTSVFVILGLVDRNEYDKADTKQSINLAAKQLINSIDKSSLTTEELSKGYTNDSTNINIDMKRLIVNFENTLKRTYPNDIKYESLKKSIKFKSVIYYDRIYFTDKNTLDSIENIEAPIYFTYHDVATGRLLYLNTVKTDVYYYDNSNNKIIDNITNYGLSEKQKNEIIINKINTIIRNYTDNVETKGVTVKIASLEGNQYFNILDGITFLVVYNDSSTINTIFSDNINMYNYNVTGYTFERSK